MPKLPLASAAITLACLIAVSELGCVRAHRGYSTCVLKVTPAADSSLPVPESLGAAAKNSESSADSLMRAYLEGEPGGAFVEITRFDVSGLRSLPFWKNARCDFSADVSAGDPLRPRSTVEGRLDFRAVGFVSNGEFLDELRSKVNDTVFSTL